MVKVKTLVEASKAINELLEMHLQAVLIGSDFTKKYADSKEARSRAFQAYLDLNAAIAPHLAKEVEVSND
jgi:hypothetical protein